MNQDLSEFEEMLTQILGKIDQSYCKIPADLTEAAVILPLLSGKNGIEVLFTRRTENVSSHRGQVSFPGGKVSEKDSDFVVTALRETEEEIGLAPSQIRIVGVLPPIPTISTGYLVYPAVAVLVPPLIFKPDKREVKDIFTVPLSYLLDDSNWKLGPVETDEGTFTTYYIRYKGFLVWGMTARLLRKFLNIVRDSSLFPW